LREEKRPRSAFDFATDTSFNEGQDAPNQCPKKSWGGGKGAYFKQELPREFRTYVLLLVVLNILAGLAALGSRDVASLVTAVVWSGLVWWLYAQLVRKKNWA
jgi:hypothetical protein